VPPKQSQRKVIRYTGKRFTAPVVCMCGSTRFKSTWINEYARLTDEGNIVLSVGRFMSPVEQSELKDLKAKLDDLHKRKIDLCDWVWVLDVNGYVGDSTRSEIAYAEKIGRPIRYLSHEFPDYVEPPYEVAVLKAQLEEAEKDTLREIDNRDRLEADLLAMAHQVGELFDIELRDGEEAFHAAEILNGEYVYGPDSDVVHRKDVDGLKDKLAKMSASASLLKTLRAYQEIIETFPGAQVTADIVDKSENPFIKVEVAGPFTADELNDALRKARSIVIKHDAHHVIAGFVVTPTD
jgi:hypothetical protein